MSIPFFIGTSGFSYSAWKKSFYPDKLPSSQWLEYYSTQFNTVEINSSFYHFPRVSTLRKMYDSTPENFRFSIKMNRQVTHYSRMKDTKNLIDEFILTAESGFGEKLGCILFQLPPSFKYTAENLDNLLKNIPNGSRFVIEFRHISWWDKSIFEALEKHNLTFCNVSFPKLPDETIMTSDVFYQRMHGVPEIFKSQYSDIELRQLAENIPGSAGQKFIYFNNTMFEAGFTNARQLISILGK